MYAKTLCGYIARVGDSFLEQQIEIHESCSTATYSTKLPCFESYPQWSSLCFNMHYELLQLHANRNEMLIGTYPAQYQVGTISLNVHLQFVNKRTYRKIREAVCRTMSLSKFLSPCQFSTHVSISQLFQFRFFNLQYY